MAEKRRLEDTSSREPPKHPKVSSDGGFSTLLEYLEVYDAQERAAKALSLRRKSCRLDRPFGSSTRKLSLSNSLFVKSISGSNSPQTYNSFLASYGLSQMKVRPIALSQQLLRALGMNRRLEWVPPRVGAVTTIEFDSIGALLASGADDGGLCIFNFDSSRKRIAKLYNKRNKIYHQALRTSSPSGKNDEKKETHNGETQEKESESEREERARKEASEGARPKRQAPVLRISTGRKVQALRWCPHDENRIAAGVQGNEEVLLYDVSTVKKSRPYLVLSGGSQTGTSSMTFGSAQWDFYIGTQGGTVKSWDTRKPNRIKWELNANPTGSKASGFSTQAVSSILLTPNQNQLIAGSLNGHILMWDLRKLSIPLFTTRPVPSLIWSTSFPLAVADGMDQNSSRARRIRRFDGVVSLIQHPTHWNELYVQMQSGKVGLFDTVLKRYISSTTLLSGTRQAKATHIFSNVEQENDFEGSTTFMPCRRNCLARLASTERDFVCAGVPSAACLYLVDLSPSARAENRVKKIPLRSSPLAVAVHPFMDSIVVSEERSNVLTIVE